LRFRAGFPTLEDIQYINEHCYVDVEDEPPANIQMATYTNKDRDALNCSVFEEYCKLNKPDDPSAVFNDALMVLSDELAMKDGKSTYKSVTSNALKRHFWATLGEADVCGPKHMAKSGRFDPVLKLYPQCPLMNTMNTNVIAGEANGSRVLFEDIHIKHGEEPMIVQLECGTKIRAFTASQVLFVTVRHETDDILPQTFTLESQTFAFKTDLEMGSDKHHVQMEAK